MQDINTNISCLLIFNQYLTSLAFLMVDNFFPLKLHAGGSDFIFCDGSNLNTYLLMRWRGPDVLAVVRPTRVSLARPFIYVSRSTSDIRVGLGPV